MRVILILSFLFMNAGLFAQATDNGENISRKLAGRVGCGLRQQSYTMPAILIDTLKQKGLDPRTGKTMRSHAAAQSGNETVVRLRCGYVQEYPEGPMYIIDNLVFRSLDDFELKTGGKLDPDSIDSITVLNGPFAAALYGSAAMKGAVVITTKLKTRTLKEVIVVSGGCRRGCGRSYVTQSRTIFQRRDSLALQGGQVLPGLKIFPNPVTRGSDFSIAGLPLQQKEMLLQVLDAGGKLIRQERRSVAKGVQTLSADAKWSTGVYYIRVIDTEGNSITQGRFLVQ